jgi:hypothetical protein
LYFLACSNRPRSIAASRSAATYPVRPRCNTSATGSGLSITPTLSATATVSPVASSSVELRNRDGGGVGRVNRQRRALAWDSNVASLAHTRQNEFRPHADLGDLMTPNLAAISQSRHRAHW